MRLGILMDPLASLLPYKDSTLAMIESATQLGWECAYFTLQDLFCLNGKPYAAVSGISTTRKGKSVQWTEKTLQEMPLSAFDILLMRKDPPFCLEYIYATYLLELAEQDGVFIANKPQGLRDANEKCFTLNFPQCCPPTLVSRDIRRLREFWEQHQRVIFKPLDGMGGASVFLVDEAGLNLSVVLETLTHRQQVTIMAQQYIPEITSMGDKRILLINGEPIPYALARIPAKGELRGNLAAGARGKVVEITDRDRWICAQIAPTLREKGLYLVGVDVIGEYLTEINVTSPTCLREISRETSIDIAGNYLAFLEQERRVSK